MRGGRHRAPGRDVYREDGGERTATLARERFGRLNVLINNAGIIISKLVVDMMLEDWHGILAMNATRAWVHSRTATRAMMPNRSGATVDVGPYACFQAFPTIAAYAASKGALAQLTRARSLVRSLWKRLSMASESTRSARATW